MLEVIRVAEYGREHSRSVSLTYDQRIRGRLKTACDDGTPLGLFIERGRMLQEGDLLEAKTGEIIMVRAVFETLISVSIKNGITLAKVCYHLGNRHVPVQIQSDKLLFQPDHVLENLCREWGLQLESVRLPFNPESGAYGKVFAHD